MDVAFSEGVGRDVGGSAACSHGVGALDHLGAPMIATISNRIHLAGAPPEVAREIKKALTMANPKFEDAQKQCRWTGSIPPTIRGYIEQDGQLFVPRGFLADLETVAGRYDEELVVEDKTRVLPPAELEFKGGLRAFQEIACTRLLQRDDGVLCAPTGAGKTCMALAMIAARAQPALVIVHTKELLRQWIKAIERFLGIPAEQVGVIGNGTRRVGERVTVAMVQTLCKCADEIAPKVGFVVADECHRCPSRTFTEAIQALDARYLLGLSATPWRRDKLGRLIFWTLGPLAHEVQRRELVQNGDILRPRVVWRETKFDTQLDPSQEYTTVLSELTKDPDRNELIASDVAVWASIEPEGIALVLSDRKGHVSALQAILEGKGVDAVTLVGDMPGRAREEALRAILSGKSRVLIATGQLVGEGFDLPAMSTLFMVTPIRFSGRVLQYIGRILRPAPGKDKAVVVDYRDGRVGVLAHQAETRRKVYGEL